MLPNILHVVTLSMFTSQDEADQRVLPPLVINQPAVVHMVPLLPPLLSIPDMQVAPLPPIHVPGVPLHPIQMPGAPAALNPKLVLNNERPTAGDVNGFGPSIRNERKLRESGVRCNDSPVCRDPAHETGNARKNMYRIKSECRGCLKEAVDSLPAFTSHWQASRYLTGLFRNYFCPFCFLECKSKGEMAGVVVKSCCVKHTVINSLITCDAHDKKWGYCKQCVHDPRSATFYCPCGVPLSASVRCVCPAALRKLSWGVRLHTNPFVESVDRAQEDQWVVESIARANEAMTSGVELPLKKRHRNSGKTIGPYFRPKAV
jgi:hypothetical protein